MYRVCHYITVGWRCSIICKGKDIFTKIHLFEIRKDEKSGVEERGSSKTGSDEMGKEAFTARKRTNSSGKGKTKERTDREAAGRSRHQQKCPACHPV